MTADGKLLDLTKTNDKIKETEDDIKETTEKTKKNLEEIEKLRVQLDNMKTTNANAEIKSTNNNLHNKTRAGNVGNTIPADYKPTMELKHFHSTNKDSTIGYGGSSIQFSTNNGLNGGGAQWPTGSIVSNIDPNNSSGYQGGLLFYTAAGGLNKPQKLTMSMGGPDQRTYFAGDVTVNGNLQVKGAINDEIVKNSYNMTYYVSDRNGTQKEVLKHELVKNKEINYSWGTGNVGSSGRRDNVFIRFKGYITANIQGNTQFRVQSDDGVRFYLENSLIINAWKLQGPTWHASGNRNLIANQRYPFTLNWYEHGGGATIRLQWKRPDKNWEYIPNTAFSTDKVDGGLLPLGSGIRSYKSWYGDPEYYKINNVVYVDGLIRRYAYTHLATLPEGYRPHKRLIFNLNNHQFTSRIDVLADGRILWVKGPDKNLHNLAKEKSNDWISLTGISFVCKN